VFMLPFTTEQFVAVFAYYNHAIWPVQAFAYLLGGVAVIFLFRESGRSDRIIAGILATMWIWTGLVYQFAFFVEINRAAYLFGAMYIAQGVAIAYAGSCRRINFGFRSDAAGWIGVTLVVYAAVLYPLIGIVAGANPAELPVFGVTPCPVTIFTLGMLLLTRSPLDLLLLVIPVLWSLIGGSAAILLQVPQDWLLLASGLLTAGFLLVRERARVSS
jgi:Family of unknown function (DUF6064)